MLRSLEIRDMLIIERLDLAFQPGLNVLTGETGAGKSILLDALGFVLGWRGRADLVRQGAEQGEVVAVFDLTADHPARAVLDEAGIPAEDDLILRRVNARDGRKTAWINDRRSSGETLRALSDTLVELHGQHDDRGLLNPRGHRNLLDAYGTLAPQVRGVKETWKQLSEARAAITQAQARIAQVQSEEEYLRHAVAELDALDPQPGEEAALDANRRLMQAAEKIRTDMAKAEQALGLNGAEGMIGDASRWLQGVADDAEGRLDAPLNALETLMVHLDEAQRGIVAALDQLSFRPSDLEDIEERLFAIRALARKHGVMPDDLGAFADDLRGRLAVLDSGAKDMQALIAAEAKVKSEYDQKATALSDARKKAGARLDQAMLAELGPLKMDRAEFTTRLVVGEAGPDGIDQVTFQVATNPGAPAGPIDKIASGGELSRFLLALKVCLTQGVSGLTMIFDEIDRGVGGATADAVGRRLSDLANGGQVLVVTHSPQVAARGAHHWRVAKDQRADMTLSTVDQLSPDARVDEIARMLAGDVITDAARDAARALMA